MGVALLPVAGEVERGTEVPRLVVVGEPLAGRGEVSVQQLGRDRRQLGEQLGVLHPATVSARAVIRGRNTNIDAPPT